MAALIEVEGLYFHHPAGGATGTRPGGGPRYTLENITVSIQPGELIALIGANGSGKTTLGRHLNGLLLPTQGSVRVGGLDTRDEQHLALIRSRVGMVFQQPEDQLVATTVEEDVAFGPENLGIPAGEIRERVEHGMTTVGITHLRHRPPYMLSGGQMQRVALAGMLAMRPDCIIFDEATAMLDPGGRKALMAQIQALHLAGITILMVTHYMDEAAVADRVLVLSRGKVIADEPPRSLFRQTALLESAGLETPPASRAAQALRPFFPEIPADVLFEEEITAAIGHYHAKDYRRVFAPASSTPSTAEIEINNLSHVYAKGSPFENVALRGVSMQVPEHAIHGLAGATGSGKSTLLQHMNGLLLPQAGQVRIGPFCMHEPNADIRGARKRAGLVFQVPENQMFEPYVGDEIAYGPRRLGLDGEALRERVRVAMTQVGLGFEEFKDRQTFTLSGGERRKVALASVLALEPAILLLDEPTAGLDPRSRAELLRMLKSLQADGKTLVISSHRMADLAELCNQLTILENGQVAADGTSEGIFQQMDTLEAAGLQPPIAVRIANILRVKGWPIQPDVLRLPQLVEALTALKESNESV